MRYGRASLCCHRDILESTRLVLALEFNIGRLAAEVFIGLSMVQYDQCGQSDHCQYKQFSHLTHGRGTPVAYFSRHSSARIRDPYCSDPAEVIPDTEIEIAMHLEPQGQQSCLDYVVISQHL